MQLSLESEKGTLLDQMKKKYPWIVKAKEDNRSFFFFVTLASESLRQSEIHQAVVKDLNGFFSVSTQPVAGLPLKNFNRDLRNGFSFLLIIINEEKTVLTVVSPREVLIDA
jgi:hypothetical protein